MDYKNFKIKTERLTLRPLSLKDIETAHEYAGDIENTKYMVYLPNKTIQETEQFLQRVSAEWEKDVPSFYEFAVDCGGKHIGAVSAYIDSDNNEIEIGWIFNKSYHGKGYASEASKALLDFAINNLNAKKIVAHCDYRNEPSYKLMEKIGLTLESSDGVRKNKCSDEYVKELKYSLVPSSPFGK